MKKRKSLIIIGIVILLIPVLFTGYNKFKKQNIYDEMYYEGAGVTNELFSFQSRSAFGDIPNMEPRVVNLSGVIGENETITEESYQRNKLPKNIDRLIIKFYKERKELHVSIHYQVTNSLGIWLDNFYNVRKKELTQTMYIPDLERKDGSVTNRDEVTRYLKEYNISKEQLEEWYDQGMNQILIKDWRSVYPSRYSDKKLGHLKIINEWE